MSFGCLKKDTVLIPSGPATDPERKHLHIILTDADESGLVMLVNVATVRDGSFHDPTCIIEPGEHEFISNRSYVDYGRIGAFKKSHIVKMVDGWVYAAHQPVSEELLERIREGIKASRFTPRKMKNTFDAFCRAEDESS